jgi:hypothetical protein
MKPGRINHPSSDAIYESTVIIQHVKGMSYKFRRIGNRFNVRTIFKTKHTLRGTLMKTEPVRDASRRSSVCTVFRVNVADVTSVKPADLWKFALRSTNTTWPRVCPKNSKLAQHAGHKICWKEAKVLQIEPRTAYRKYKESAHMSQAAHPISQPSLDISPFWTSIIAAEVRALQPRPV